MRFRPQNFPVLGQTIMKTQCDILIIGAGVIGVCTAHCLAEAGFQPLVVDRGDICAGASYANAGLIVPSSWTPVTRPDPASQLFEWMRDGEAPIYIPPQADPHFWAWFAQFLRASDPAWRVRSEGTLQALTARSMELYRAWMEELPLECDFQAQGGLHLYASLTAFRHGMAHALAHRASGGEAVILDRTMVVERVPLATDIVIGGVLYPGDGQLAPDRFVQGLAVHAQRQGVSFQTQTEVVDLEVDQDRITAVITTRGRIEAEYVVMATGAWSGRLGQAWGIDIPIQPAKGYSYTIPRPDGCSDLPLSLDEPGVSINPMGNQLRIAGTLEFTGLDDRLRSARARRVGQAAVDYLGVDPFAAPAEIWRGWRPMTPDGVPLIAWSERHPNLLVAAGHNKIGMTLGPVTGEIATRLLRGEPAGFEGHALDCARFA